MNPALVISSLFALAIIALCLWRPQAGRIVMGVFFLAMAAVNLIVTLNDASLYVAYGSTALLGLYRWFFREIVAQTPLLWGAVLVALEAAVGLLILGKGASVRQGLLGAILLLLAISPLGIETLANLGLALATALLLRQPYRHGLGGMLRKWFSPSKP